MVPGVVRGLVLFVLYYGAWTATVATATQSVRWLGPSLAALIAALSFGWAGVRARAYFRFVAGVTIVGAAADAAFLYVGLIEYVPAEPRIFAPLWMTSLWVMFAATLPISLRWIYGRVLVGAASGLVFGPAAYFTCAALGALTIDAPLITAVVLGSTWAIVMAFIAKGAPNWLPVTGPAMSRTVDR